MKSGRATLWLALGLSGVYLLTFGGHYVMGDHAVRMAWARHP